MTDKEMIKRLLLLNEVDAALAADRIEELVKERTALGHMFNAAYNRHVAEIIAVETKLADVLAKLADVLAKLRECETEVAMMMEHKT